MIRLIVDKITTVLLVLSFIGICVGCSSPAEKQFNQFQSDVKATIDPLKLQEWAKVTLQQRSDGYQIPNDDLPVYLRNVGLPGNVSGFVSDWNQSGPRVVILHWGGGFRTWGLIVGDKTYVGPKEDSNNIIASWVPGIYFFQGKH